MFGEIKFNVEQRSCMVKGFNHKSYEERMKLLNITSLEKRIIKGD